MRNKPGERKLHVKEVVVPEHNHQLRNRHGPMVAQKCLGTKMNSLRKFALVSCFELPKQTQNKLCFGLILNDIISVHSSILFEVYQGLYGLK